MKSRTPLILSALLLLLAGCEDPADSESEAPRDARPGPGEQLWQALEPYCGKAFRGELVESREGDEAFADQEVTVHLRECSDHRILAPLVVGEDASRTWVIERHPDGVHLSHEHRYEDGEPEATSGYGGIARPPADSRKLEFPVDENTLTLLPGSVGGVWTLGIENDTLVYQVRREGAEEAFRLEFDLREPVEEPSAPWGWSEIRDFDPANP